MSGLMTPSDAALTRLASGFAIFLRPGSAVACAIAAPMAATSGVSAPLLATVLVTLTAWAGVFVVMMVWRGPSLPVILADTALVTGVVLAQERLVPEAAIRDGTTWTLMLASTAVFIAQLTMRPAFGLPAAGVVTVAYYLSTDLPTGLWFLPLQAVVITYLVGLLRHGGQSADRVIAKALAELQQARLREVRRADERAQYRRLHDTVLSTLAMVASGAFDGRSAVVSAKARDGLTVLTELAAAPRSESANAALLPLLTEIAERAVPLLVRVTGVAPPLPRQVADSIGGAVAEALENVIRHSGVGRADVRVRAEHDGVVVEVTDSGAGFDRAEVPASRRGIKESIEGRLAAAGGTAEVIGRPAAGTRVVLRWPDG